LFGPAIELIKVLATPLRFRLMALAYGVPLGAVLAILLWGPGVSGAGWPLIALCVAFVAALYLVLCWHLQASAGFRGVHEAVERLSRGDLRASGDRSNRGLIWSLAYQLDDVSGGLAQALGKIRASADEIGAASHQIAAGHADLSRRTEEQTATLTQTAAGMEELAATVKQNAVSCERADELAKNADAVAHKGAQTVQRAVERMGLIDQSSRKIADIIGVIEGIAFQTNILALNAAVEAARAGEQGKGFAVVAAEVRSLAQRSGDAARQIKTLIDESAANVSAGDKLVAEAGTIIKQIVTGVRQVMELIAEVARASKEQSHGVEEINHAIVQMEGVTRQNAALVEQVTLAARAFEEEAQRLSQAVDRFSFTGHAATATPSHARSAPRAATRAEPPRPAPVLMPQQKLPRYAAAPAASVEPRESDEWEEF
jgi:methyl-accepting chemotaxis protein